MDLQIVTRKGNVLDAGWSNAVDHLLEMHKKTDQWEFIEKLIGMWARKDPELYRSYQSKAANEKARGVMQNKFGATKDLGARIIADIPVGLYSLLEFFYAEEIKDKKWILEFVKHFPMFKVPEKL